MGRSERAGDVITNFVLFESDFDCWIARDEMQPQGSMRA